MKTYIPLLVAIALINTAGQIAIKKGISGAPAGQLVMTAAKSAWVWVGLVLYGGSFGLWLLALSRVELSFAYPFVSISYVLITVWGALVLKEDVNAWRVAGIACIVAGIFCIAQSARCASPAS